MMSIVIIVKNDRGIEKTLESLQSIPKPCQFEILVIDASEGKLNDIKNKFPNVRWINYKNHTGKRTTIPEQRNLGVKKSKGRAVVFIDANCIPVKNWLVELYKCYSTYNDPIICGPILPSRKNSLNNLWDSRNKSTYRNECPSGNILIDKQVYSEIGLYDEKLSYGEDVDLTWRASSAGFRIRHNRRAIIYHDWGNFTEEIYRSFKYGKARALLFKKHHSRWQYLIHTQYVILFYAFYVLFLPITIIFPLYPLFILFPLVKNMNKYSVPQLLKLPLVNVVNSLGFIKGFVFGF